MGGIKEIGRIMMFFGFFLGFFLGILEYPQWSMVMAMQWCMHY